MRISALRLSLGVVGVAVAGYGGWLLFSRQDLHQLTNLAEWLVGGVVLHDAVLAPVVVVVGWICARTLPAHLRGLLVRILVLLGPVTLIAVPVLFGGGNDPTNPTIDGRDYARGWVAVAIVCVLAALLATTMAWTAGRCGERRADGAGTDRRRRHHRS